MNVRSIRFRMTAWYAGLLAGALLIFGASVYLGLERYLYWNLERGLSTQCSTIGAELLPQISHQSHEWLEREINETYAPEVNSNFVRVTGKEEGIVYVSGAPKDGAFDPSRVPSPGDKDIGRSRKVQLGREYQLLIETKRFTMPGGSQFLVESGAPSEQIRTVLHGLLLTFAIYVPFIVSLAVTGGYWLMRRSLRPVDEITKQAEGITSRNLSERLPEIRTGDEIERLSAALNRMIERLDQAFQHVNRFSADASHELRTPLTILQLELEGIVQNQSLSPGLAEQMGSVLEETQRMSRIVENLLTVSRLDAGEVRMEKKRLDLGQLVASTADQMKLLAEEKSIALISDLASDVWVEGDRAYLQQVIVNLMDNAIKYTHEGGQVGVCVRRNASTAVLEVSDNGVGIPSDALPHVFERFYRTDKARSRDSGGAGLGLAIVKAICTAHGARVSVSSKEGNGSCFAIEVPLLDVLDANLAKSTLRAPRL